MLELPWTAPPLTLNQRRATRGAMFAHAQKIAEVRQTVYELATAAGLPRGLDHVTVTLHYRPRDNRRRDTDNLVATAKPAYDALTPGRPARWSRPKDPTKKPRLVPAQIGHGLVADDTPAFMSKPEPVIHRAEKGKGGAMWLEITWNPDENAPGKPVSVPEQVLAVNEPSAPVVKRSRPRRAAAVVTPPSSERIVSLQPVVSPAPDHIPLPVHGGRSTAGLRDSRPPALRDTSRCTVCGGPITQPGTGRPRKTCSGACRVRAHREEKKKISAEK